jgi:tetratricopeptide (TPR) repeat protein
MAAKRSNFRKSLKGPDEFVTLSSRILQSVVAYKKHALAAIGGIFLLVVAVLLFGYFSEKSEKHALLRLSQIMAKYADQDASQEMSEIKDELRQFIDGYGRYSGGKFARLELANLYFSEGDYDQAIELYGRSAKDFQSVAFMKMLAKSGLGYSLEAKGEYEKAVECFESVAANSKDAMADEALFSLGRLYAALGNSEKQSEASSRLIEEYPDSLYVDLVKEKAAQ